MNIASPLATRFLKMRISYSDYFHPLKESSISVNVARLLYLDGHRGSKYGDNLCSQPDLAKDSWYMNMRPTSAPSSCSISIHISQMPLYQLRLGSSPRIIKWVP